VEPYCDATRERKDDVGCGDACQAAIVDALLKGYPLELALRAGARQGFEALTVAGAGGGLGGDQMQEYLNVLRCKAA
jgi:sugar/nucleoside kinase (ribokinase family)